MKLTLEGSPPKDPRQRVLMVEAAVQAICQSVNQDPADAVMALLTAAAHMHYKQCRHDVPMKEVGESLAFALGHAIVAADDFFRLKEVRSHAPEAKLSTDTDAAN